MMTLQELTDNELQLSNSGLRFELWVDTSETLRNFYFARKLTQDEIKQIEQQIENILLEMKRREVTS